VFYLPDYDVVYESTLRFQDLQTHATGDLWMKQKLQVILLQASARCPLLTTTLRAFHSSPILSWSKIQE
jgi:hypothetical protein